MEAERLRTARGHKAWRQGQTGNWSPRAAPPECCVPTGGHGLGSDTGFPGGGPSPSQAPAPANSTTSNLTCPLPLSQYHCPCPRYPMSNPYFTSDSVTPLLGVTLPWFPITSMVKPTLLNGASWALCGYSPALATPYELLHFHPQG